MANQTLRGRGGAGTPRQRSVAAATRAAAKRAERIRRPTEPAPEPAAQPPTGQADRPTRSRPGLPTAGLAVLILLGLVATAALGLRYQEAGRTTEARTAALAAARKAAPVILSYDYRHLDRDFRAARAHLTAPFLDQYGKTTKAVVAPTAKKYRGVVKATVAKPTGGDAPAASVVSAGPDQAVVLIFMNQVTTSTQVADRRLDLNRVRMTLVRTEHGWKVKAVDAL
ncbi:hypothetical protein AR457_02595 [Streptomyces agglomeratus]|uniref:hypothetical protein n=1 Tax=Streptomyces agglomeratus TaxID=285458 RepID=UPI000854B73F|nr:hypothetical protein [Streptomyces agglomeratus]OEJ43146.1 hypothetical protein AR457_02595 [Streptomyces agglomeratus]OEJ62305.1 hypothetical protein BGM19_34100 [Streptomyces agglomeratus]